MRASRFSWWLTLCVALIGCASPPEPHRGPIEIEEASADPAALNLSPELAETLALHGADSNRRFVRVRLELREGLLRVGDRIDVLHDQASDEVVLWSLLVVGHDPERRWATLMLHEDDADLLVALPSPLHARLNDPHGTPLDVGRAEEPDSDIIPPQARRPRRRT